MKIKLCSSFFSRARGLMFQKQGSALLDFKKEGFWEIWMFGMKYDLILYFLDAKGIVVDKIYAKKLSLNPATWKIYRGSKPYRYVLEVDIRDLDKFNFEVGEDALIFIKQTTEFI